MGGVILCHVRALPNVLNSKCCTARRSLILIFVFVMHHRTRQSKAEARTRSSSHPHLWTGSVPFRFVIPTTQNTNPQTLNEGACPESFRADLFVRESDGEKFWKDGSPLRQSLIRLVRSPEDRRPIGNLISNEAPHPNVHERRDHDKYIDYIGPQSRKNPAPVRLKLSCACTGYMTY